MKAIGYKVPGPIAADAALVDINLPRPVAAGYDILVGEGRLVNPVDYKVRNSTPPADGDWKVLGWDAAGIVREVGPDVTQFELGDEVYYAGSITRPGTNAEFHLVDARIVGHKPASLSWAEAALPLTTLTAWRRCSTAWTWRSPYPVRRRRSSSSVARAGLGRSPSRSRDSARTSPSSPQPLDRKPKSG